MGIATRCLLLCCAFLLASSVAWAQRVLIVQPPPEDSTLYEAFGRLQAELELQAFEVVTLEPPPTPLSPDELEREAQRLGAFAVVALQRKANGTTADVCIVDRVTGKTTTRKLSIEKTKDGPILLAIRAVDLLRASLAELRAGERPPPDVVGATQAPPPREVVAFARQRPLLQIRAGALGLASPALGVSFGVALQFALRPTERLRLALELGGPLFGAAFQVDAGSANVRQEQALFEASWNFGATTPGRHLEWGPLLGAGVNHLQATGNVEPPLVALSDDAWTFAAVAGGSVEYFFNDTVSLALELAALGLAPQPVIAVDEQRTSAVGVQGRGSLGLGVSF